MNSASAQDTTRATAVHGDVAGYSKLTADNEIETHNNLQAFRRVIEEVVSHHAGDLVAFVGDEFLAILPTEHEGLTAAIDIQRRIAEENESLPEGRKMRFRLGVNAGEISVADDRWFGDAINVAARLQALADPGGINVSRGTLDAAGELNVRVESLGSKRLKNIPEPVPVYRVVDEEMPEGDVPSWRRRIPTSHRPSLAVSPFVNLGAEEDGHFADGLMMALVISLMQLPGVDVVSESSTLGYRDRPFSAQQLGHELGVRYVLEGAAQRGGTQVRVLTQLIDVEKGTTVWADRFQASFDDLFAAQDDIVSSIVEALDVEVVGGDPARLRRSRLAPEAVEVAYRGLQYLSKGSPADLELAVGAFEEVIELQPDSPGGYTGAALTHSWMAMFGATDDPNNHYAKAEELALAAVNLEDESGIGHTILAQVRVQRREWDGALEAVEKATAMRPSCDLTYGVAGSVMRYLGRWEEAVDYANRAVRLSPLFALWYESIRADAEFIGGNYEIAADVAEAVVAEDETDVDALLTLAAAQSALGRSRHAAAAVNLARHTRPRLTAASLRADLPYRDTEALSRFVAELEAAGLE